MANLPSAQEARGELCCVFAITEPCSQLIGTAMEEIMIRRLGFGGVALNGIGSTDLEMRECADRVK